MLCHDFASSTFGASAADECFCSAGYAETLDTGLECVACELGSYGPVAGEACRLCPVRRDGVGTRWPLER